MQRTRSTKQRTRKNDFAEGHVREIQGLVLSSIGIGTRIGEPDDDMDTRYREAIVEAAAHGCNLFDTAFRYREGRSENVLGEALAEIARSGGIFADPVVCTKGGTMDPGALPSVLEGLSSEAVVDDRHSLAPAVLEAQLDVSLDRLSTECVDVYYLEGLEAHAGRLGDEAFAARLAGAFEALERARERGKLRFYGVSSSRGLLLERDEQDYVSWESVVETARNVGGEEHGMRFLQSPYSITFPEAMTGRNQVAKGTSCSLIQAATALGSSFVAAEPLASGRGLEEEHPWLPGVLEESSTLPQQELQFVRSTPGVAAAVVGMSHAKHVQENLALARIPTLPQKRFSEIVPPEAPQVPWLY